MNDLDHIEKLSPEEAKRLNATLAGQTGSKPGWSLFGPTIGGRKCGHCNFCCIVVPVERPLNKPAAVRCKHLKHKGCSIYQQRPDVCAAWKCAWLYQSEAKILIRPDLSGYAIDCALQQIFIEEHLVQVIQVWCDYQRHDAYKAPELRAYLAIMAEKHRLPAIVTWPRPKDGNQDGEVCTALFAPCLTDTGQWEEITSPMIPKHEMDRLKEERAVTG